MEEMVASKCWPLGSNRPAMRVEMVKLPIFSEEVRSRSPHFNIKLAEGETPKDFTTFIEQEAQEIIDDMSDKEYLAQKVIMGTMPFLNRIFEELGYTIRSIRFM